MDGRQVESRRPRRWHRVAGPWPRHGRTRGRRQTSHRPSTCAPSLAAKTCRTARCPVERRRPPRWHRVAGPWSRHGRTRGRRQASHRPSTCAPSLAALVRRTGRGARWTPLGRQLHEVLELHSTAPPRRRRGSRTRGRRKAFHRSWMRAWSRAVLGRRIELRRGPPAGRLGRATRSRRARRNASHSPLIRAASLAASGGRIERFSPAAGRSARACDSIGGSSPLDARATAGVSLGVDARATTRRSSVSAEPGRSSVVVGSAAAGGRPAVAARSRTGRASSRASAASGSARGSLARSSLLDARASEGVSAAVGLRAVTCCLGASDGLGRSPVCPLVGGRARSSPRGLATDRRAGNRGAVAAPDGLCRRLLADGRGDAGIVRSRTSLRLSTRPRYGCAGRLGRRRGRAIGSPGARFWGGPGLGVGFC